MMRRDEQLRAQWQQRTQRAAAAGNRYYKDYWRLLPLNNPLTRKLAR